VRAVFLRILGFVILIDLFYMSIGQWYLTQSEEHPPPELEIAVDTDTDTLLGMGQTLVKAKGGCLLCHKITEVGNTRGPDLRGVGGRAVARKPGMSAEVYLTESLVDPGAYVVAEFATAGGMSIMPAADKPPADLSPTELKAVVAYLQSRGSEVTVEITAQDVAMAEARKKPAAVATSTHPGFALLSSQGCVACHDVTGTARLVGPPLSNVHERLSAAEIRESITDPNAVIAEGFQPDLMLRDFAERLSPEELDQLVAYLSREVGLSERLAHPAVHLLGLILLFNGGVAWAMRRVSSAATAEASTGTMPSPEPNNRRLWLLLGAFVASFVGLVYLGIQALSPEPPAEKPVARAAPQTARPAAAPAQPAAPAAAMDGRALYMRTCVACHGPDAKGVAGLGKDMTASAFVAELTDAELVEFIVRGRGIDDPMNTTGVPMPPKGANPALTDADILLIVEFVRSLGN
jgi:disulfide bond formation protein DsbB